MSQQTAIQGKDVLLEVLVSGVYQPFLCSDAISVTVTPEVIRKSTVGDARGIYHAVRRVGYGMTVSGINQIVSSSTGYFSFSALDLTAIVAGYSLRASFTDPLGNYKRITATAFLESGTLSAAAQDFSEYDLQFILNGIPVIETSITALPGVAGGEFSGDFSTDFNI